MKAMIWIGCIFFAALLMVIIQNAAGIALGPLVKTVIVGGACGIAVALCRKCNKKRNNQNDDTDEP